MRPACLTVLLALSATLCAAPRDAGASPPTVWSRARDPALAKRAEVLAEVEALMMPRAQGREVVAMRMRDAKRLLEQGDAARSPDVTLRLRYGQVLYELAEYAAAAPVFESVLRMNPAPAVLADLYPDLGITYAHLGRRREEIAAYGSALDLETRSVARARIMANRAESYMLLGELPSAVDGYRAALSSLSQLELAVYGPTTFWGLGVALDRSGDLDESLAAIRLARAYDPADRMIDDRSTWFYEPPYEEHWYKALGNWSAARGAETQSGRAERYNRAVEAWEEYIASAATGDRWVPLGRVRLSQCEKERDAAMKRARSSAPPTAEKTSAVLKTPKKPVR